LVWGCGPAHPSSRQLLAEASTTEFGDGLGCIETVEVARRAGYDYEQVVKGCLARSRQSMHIFFWLSAFAGYDAASSEGNAAVCGALLREVGDTFFGDCLSREPAAVQERVREDLLYDIGRGGQDDRTDLEPQYPLTFGKAGG
jgi:hypothetical protein